MSGRSAKASRRAHLARAHRARSAAASVPRVIDIDDLVDRFEAAGGRGVPVDRDPAIIRERLGGKSWMPPMGHGTGWRFQRLDDTLVVLVTAACWPDLPDVPIIHASISRHTPVRIPTYDDLQLLHRAVWPAGNALQAFVPSADHINIKSTVLHLWGRSDNQRLWPVDFGRFGTI